MTYGSTKSLQERGVALPTPNDRRVVGIDAPAVWLVMSIRLFFSCRVGYSVVLQLSGGRQAIGRPANRQASSGKRC